ncbi:hypothetical protein WA538_003341 [Blastocystis sp. DL]
MDYTPVSKYRHVYCPGLKPEEIYQGFRVATTTGDQNYIKGNSKYFAFPAGGGGGPILIRAHHTPGRMPSQLPLLTGHKGDLCDFDFNPFNDEQIISSSADLSVMLWQFPEGGPKENITEPILTLNGHHRKVTFVEFNPVANLIAVSASADGTSKVWDCNLGDEVGTYDFKGLPQDLHWNYSGSLFCVSTKDKMNRIFDPRENRVVGEWSPHDGTKCSKMAWLGDSPHVVTAGFNRTSQREYKLWDLRALAKPLSHESLDQASGTLFPFFDTDTKILYLAGKGDGNIRYFEVKDSSLCPLSQYSSTVSARGLCMLPKSACNVNKCEIAVILKLTPRGDVEPLPFILPRKFEGYQPDVYPPTFAGVPALSNEEWRCGENKNPVLRSLEPGNPVLSTTEYHPIQIDATPAAQRAAAPVARTPVAQSTQSATSATSAPQPQPTMGYVPKQGKMTIEDVEQELEMLAKRMEFLGQTLQELKKENAKNM